MQPPPKNLWNGLPRRYVVDYVHSDQHNSINVSLGGLNMDRPLGVWLNDTEAHKNYSVRVTMCTGAGCRGNFSQPCFIDAVTEDSNNEGWSKLLKCTLTDFGNGGGSREMGLLTPPLPKELMLAGARVMDCF